MCTECKCKRKWTVEMVILYVMVHFYNLPQVRSFETQFYN